MRHIFTLKTRLLAAMAVLLAALPLSVSAQMNSIPCSADDFNFSLYESIDGKIEGGYNGLGSFRNGYKVVYKLNNTAEQAYTLRFAYKGGTAGTTIKFTFEDQDYNVVEAQKTVSRVDDWAYTELDIATLAYGEITMTMTFQAEGYWACNMKEMSFQAQSAEKYVELPTVAFDLLRYTENQTAQPEDQRTSTTLESFRNGGYVTYLLNNTIDNKYLIAFEAGTPRDDASIDVIVTNKESGEELCAENVVVKNTGAWNVTNLYVVELPTMAIDKYVLKLVFRSVNSEWTANLKNLQFKDGAALTQMEEGNITLASPWTTKGQIKCAQIIDSSRNGAEATYLLKNTTDGATYNVTALAATPNAGVSIRLSALTLSGDTLATKVFDCETCSDWKDYRELKLRLENVAEGFVLLAINIMKSDGQWCANIGSITLEQEGVEVYVTLPATDFDLRRYTDNTTAQAEDQRTATKLESFRNGGYATYLIDNQEDKAYLIAFEGSTDRDDAAVNISIVDKETGLTAICDTTIAIVNTGSWNTWNTYFAQLPIMATGKYVLKLTFMSSDANWTANVQNLRFADSAVVNTVADGSAISFATPWQTSGQIKCAQIIDSSRNGAKAVYLAKNSDAETSFDLIVKAATPNEGVQLKVSALTLSGDTLATNTLDMVKGDDWNTTQDLTYALGVLPEDYLYIVFDIIKNDGSWAVNIHEAAFAKHVQEPQPEPDPIIVTVKSVSREYGEANPVFEYEVKGGTLEGAPELSCEATATSAVGEYDITISMGTITNEKVTLNAGKMTITKATLTVTANDQTRDEGQPNPELTLSYEGFKNGETEDVLTTKPTAATEATAESKAGDYAITVSGGEAQNYTFEYVAGKLTIKEVVTGIAGMSGQHTFFNVYDINGRLVGRQLSTLKNLPKGIYTIEGKKIVIK